MMDGIIDMEIVIEMLRSTYDEIDGLDELDSALDTIKRSAEALEAEMDFWYTEADNHKRTIAEQDKTIDDLESMLEDIPSDEL